MTRARPAVGLRLSSHCFRSRYFFVPSAQALIRWIDDAASMMTTLGAVQGEQRETRAIDFSREGSGAKASSADWAFVQLGVFGGARLRSAQMLSSS